MPITTMIIGPACCCMNVNGIIPILTPYHIIPIIMKHKLIYMPQTFFFLGLRVWISSVLLISIVSLIIPLPDR